MVYTIHPPTTCRFCMITLGPLSYDKLQIFLVWQSFYQPFIAILTIALIEWRWLTQLTCFFLLCIIDILYSILLEVSICLVVWYCSSCLVWDRWYIHCVMWPCLAQILSPAGNASWEPLVAWWSGLIRERSGFGHSLVNTTAADDQKFTEYGLVYYWLAPCGLNATVTQNACMCPWSVQTGNNCKWPSRDWCLRWSYKTQP